MTVTDHSQTADVGELSRAITSLAEVLARTEKRSAQLTRIIQRSGRLGHGGFQRQRATDHE